jgi:hypothetical protein
MGVSVENGVAAINGAMLGVNVDKVFGNRAQAVIIKDKTKIREILHIGLLLKRSG